MSRYPSCFQNSVIVRKAFSASGGGRQSLRALGFLTEYAQNLSEGQICAFLIGDSIDRRLPFGMLAAAYDVETALLCHEIKQLENSEIDDLFLYKTFSPKAKEIVLATLMLVLDSFVMDANADLQTRRFCLEKVEHAVAALMPMKSPRMYEAFCELLSKARAAAGMSSPVYREDDASSVTAFRTIN